MRVRIRPNRGAVFPWRGPRIRTCLMFDYVDHGMPRRKPSYDVLRRRTVNKYAHNVLLRQNYYTPNFPGYADACLLFTPDLANSIIVSDKPMYIEYCKLPQR